MTTTSFCKRPHGRLHWLKPMGLSLSMLALATTAWAQKSPAVDRVSIWAGGYQATAKGDLTATTPDGAYTTGPQRVIDGTDTIYRGRVDWLLFDNQGFSIDYYRFKRSDTRSVGGSFDYGGVSYLSGAAQASATATVDVGNFSYRWWFGSGDTAFGIGAGAAYYKIKLDYSASAAVGGLSDSIVGNQSKDAWAPLLTLGWRQRINDDFRVYADVSGARKNGDRNGGDIVNAAMGVEYFPWHNLGVGAEYGATRIRYNYQGSDANANLRLRLNGPSLFLRVRF